jgi:uncharacterized protein (DUF2164 family)
MFIKLFYPADVLLQFIPLYYFYFYNKKIKEAKEYRRARLKEIRQEFLDATIESRL